MDFVAVVDQVIALLRQRGRVTYSPLKRQFQLDEAALEDLKIELIKGQRLAVDERGNVLVWIGDDGLFVTRQRPLPVARSATTRLHPTLSRGEDLAPPGVPWKASANRSPCCSPT